MTNAERDKALMVEVHKNDGLLTGYLLGKIEAWHGWGRVTAGDAMDRLRRRGLLKPEQAQPLLPMRATVDACPFCEGYGDIWTSFGGNRPVQCGHCHGTTFATPDMAAVNQNQQPEEGSA